MSFFTIAKKVVAVEIDLIHKGIMTRFLFAACTALRSVEIDLIHKGIMTIIRYVPFKVELSDVEIDLIHKGIMTQGTLRRSQAR